MASAVIVRIRSNFVGIEPSCVQGRIAPHLREINSLRIIQAGLGFWQAECLLSAIELGLFTQLGTSARTKREIGEALGLHPKGVPDFLDGLVAMKLLERDGSGDDALYRNTEA